MAPERGRSAWKYGRRRTWLQLTGTIFINKRTAILTHDSWIKISHVKEKQKARYGSGSLYQRGAIWHVSYREVKRLPDGNTKYVQHRVSTHSQDREFARKFLNRKLLEVGGRRPMMVEPDKVSYETIRDNYLANCVEKKLRSLRRSKDGTVTLTILPRLDKFFGTWRAAEVTVAHLKRFRAEARTDGLADARINRYMAALRAMFNQARKDELLTRTEIPAYFPMVKEPNEARGAIFIQPEWYAALCKILKEPLRSAFILAYHFAVRVGELERIRWRDVNVQKRLITLPGEITKTGKPRLVPLPSSFDRKPGQPEQLVFPLGDCRGPWREACIKVGAGYNECGECGSRCPGRKCPTHGKLSFKKLRYRGLTLRHTRHTAVRNMSDAGMPETRIMATSGHVTRAMFDRYNIGKEKDVDRTRKAVERFHRKH
jgi:integrase